MNDFNMISLHKEIDLIESCITRMSKNSFTLKGWLISIIAVILALLPQKAQINIHFICFLVICITVCFWCLDGFYLKRERLYREKYSWVIVQRVQGNTKYLYDLNPYNKNMWLNPDLKINIINSILSPTIAPFYGLTIIISLIVLYFK